MQTLQSETNTISLLALSMPVSGARALSLAGLGIVLGLSGWLIISSVRRANREQKGAMAGNSRLRNSMVNVRGSVPAPRTRVVDVASLEDLGRIASKLGAVVLQEARPGYHAFFVHDMDLTYRYEALGTEQEHSTEPVIQEDRVIAKHVPKLAIGSLVALIGVSVFGAAAAGNTVPPTLAGQSDTALLVSQLAPPECAGMGLTVLQGRERGQRRGNALVIGYVGQRDVKWRRRDGCIIAGSGSDTLNGQGGDDVLISGPGFIDFLNGGGGNEPATAAGS